MNIQTEPPPRRCSEDRLERLKKLGFKTNGYIKELEEIIFINGFGLPGYENDYFGFTINYKYMRFCLTYTDALAEELILLKELKLI